MSVILNMSLPVSLSLSRLFMSIPIISIFLRQLANLVHLVAALFLFVLIFHYTPLHNHQCWYSIVNSSKPETWL